MRLVPRLARPERGRPLRGNLDLGHMQRLARLGGKGRQPVGQRIGLQIPQHIENPVMPHGTPEHVIPLLADTRFKSQPIVAIHKIP